MGTNWATGHLYMFGGADNSTAFGDTWLWTGADWRQVPGVGPSPRSACGELAYDGRNAGLLLFGGWDSAQRGPLADTWLLDGAGWRQLSAAGPIGALAGHVTMTEGATGDIFVYGGSTGGTSALTGLWRWRGTSWTNVPTTTHPEARFGIAGAWDGHQCIAFGGLSNNGRGMLQTWKFDSVDWSILDDPFQHRIRKVLHDVAHDRILTFEDPATITAPGTMSDYRNGVQGPRQNLPFEIVYAAAHHVMSGSTLVFAVDTASNTSSRWVYDGQSWVPDPHVAPIDAGGSIHYYDSRRAKLVFANPDTKSMHSWDPVGGWTRTAWQGQPNLRPIAHGYDAGRDRFAVYNFNDAKVWEWNGAQWHAPITPREQPSGGFASQFVYSPLHGGLLLVRPGFDTTDRGLWLWNGQGWRQLSNGRLFDRYIRSAAYDLTRNRLYVTYSSWYPQLWEAEVLPLMESNRLPRLGETVRFTPTFACAAGQPLVVALSHDTHPGIPIRRNAAGLVDYFPLAPGPLLGATLQAVVLDGLGRGSIAYTIPNDPRLLGHHLFAAGLTLGSGGAPDLITNSTDLWIKR